MQKWLCLHVFWMRTFFLFFAWIQASVPSIAAKNYWIASVNLSEDGYFTLKHGLIIFFQIYLNYFNLLTPCLHSKVIHTWANLQLSVAGLFKWDIQWRPGVKELKTKIYIVKTTWNFVKDASHSYHLLLILLLQILCK